VSRTEFRRARDDGERARRREALLGAARQLFDGGNLVQVTMAGIAAEAGVAKGTAYLYFPTKEALFLDLLLEELDGWAKELGPAIPSSAGPVATADAFARTLAARPTLVRLLGYLHNTLEPGADAESLVAFKQRLLTTLFVAAPKLEAALGPGAEGKGVRLFLHAHALVVGIGEMATAPPALWDLLATPPWDAFDVDFEEELREALRALFSGAVPPR
jgi:AcrR family transcriptional regulator